MRAPTLPIPELTLEAGTPRSASHGDIYFSAQDGLAETRHVFLTGNGLPQRFTGRGRFTIAETGFGTGLNFLAAWQAWEDAGAPGELVFISVEQSPLTAKQMRAVLASQPVDGAKREWLIENTPLRIPGWHRMRCGKVHLMVGYGDASSLYKQLDARVDAWFLDGFAPAKNPDMWQPKLFAEIARLSATGCTLATFTAAGSVRNGLAEAGFAIEKIRGFGHKRDMVRGVCGGGCPPAHIPTSKEIAVIGAGIAGAATAHALAELGHHVHVYEAGDVAGGASGNPAGVLYPNIGRKWNTGVAQSFLAYAHMQQQLRAWKQQGLNVTYDTPGMLKLPKDDAEKERLMRLQGTIGLDASVGRWVSREEASEKASIALPDGAAWFPHGSWLQPTGLCRALLRHPNITLHLNQHIETLPKADAVVLACAYGAQSFLPKLPLFRSAGQLSIIESVHLAAMPTAILCHRGYVVPQQDRLIIGATYDHDDLRLEMRAAHHALNIADCNAHVPGLLCPEATPSSGRVAHRTTTRNKQPIIGAISDDFAVPVYGNVAHGSRGLLTAPYGATHIAAEISGLPLDVPVKTP
jgi:tRNA 5-methylaminomethyl-2-thiouridine biosynthesis bifunctional protein